MFIGSGKREEEICKNSENKKPALIAPFELNGKAAVPPTSLKGMISSVMEAAANSALRVLENKVYSRRMKMRESLFRIGLVTGVRKEEEKIIIELLPLRTQAIKTEKQNRRNNWHPSKVLYTFFDHSSFVEAFPKRL